jgi:hypothetical protein
MTPNSHREAGHTPRRMFGMSEIWRDDSTGTMTLYLLFVPIWSRHFTHSTGVFD